METHRKELLQAEAQLIVLLSGLNDLRLDPLPSFNEIIRYAMEEHCKHSNYRYPTSISIGPMSHTNWAKMLRTLIDNTTPRYMNKADDCRALTHVYRAITYSLPIYRSDVRESQHDGSLDL